MLYFSDAPISPGDVEHEQYEALCTFKEKCKQKGLIATYNSIGEFENKFRTQLARRILDEFSVDEKTFIDKLEVGVLANDSESLSDEAIQMLVAATKTNTGYVYFHKSMRSKAIQTDNEVLCAPENRREETKWESAFRQLVDRELLEERGSKGETFVITDKGYDFVDHLEKQ